jgi:hypothetical protein
VQDPDLDPRALNRVTQTFSNPFPAFRYLRAYRLQDDLMSYLKTALIAASALTGTLGFASAANAQAFYLQEQSARGAGRAFSGEGADTGAASLWWNPAAIAGIENMDVSLSASAILPR